MTINRVNNHQPAKPRDVGIVGVPMDLGAGRRGVDMGPYAIRYAGLEHGLLAMGLRVFDHHNIPVPGPESTDAGNPRCKYDDLIESACGGSMRMVTSTHRTLHRVATFTACR